MSLKALLCAMMLITSASYAGDNGSTIICKSLSGRTTVELYDQQVFLDEDQPTNEYSAVINVKVDQAVAQYSVGGYSAVIFDKGISYKRDGVSLIELTKINKKQMKLMGVDPRTNSEMKSAVILTCKEIANPI
jgi:hypothetical protein